MHEISLYRESRRADIAKPTKNIHIAVNDVDIFVNPDFSEYGVAATGLYQINYVAPTENHKCHIFINDMDVVNGALKEYVQRFIRVSKKKVTIHVPKGTPNVRHALDDLFSGIDRVKIISSKNSYLFVFYVDDGCSYWSCNPGYVNYLIMLWSDFTKDMKREVYGRSEGGVL